MTAKRTFETHALDICVDCLMFIANGDTPEPTNDYHWSDDGDGEQYSTAEFPDGWHPSNLSEWDGWNLFAGGTHEDCEHGDGEDCPLEEGNFSWSSCDACGSSLGGDRHRAVAMRELQPLQVAAPDSDDLQFEMY